MDLIEFYPLSVDYIDEFSGNHRGIIRLFGRTKDGQRICVLDRSFSNYFWVTLENKGAVKSVKEEILDLKIHERKRVAYATEVSLEKKKYLGKEVYALKVEVNNPRDIMPLREEIRKMGGVVTCLEIDIPFVQRYMREMKLNALALCAVEGEEIENSYRSLTFEATNIKQIGEEILENPKVLSFDIEVYNARRSPNEEEDPILMIAFSGSDGFEKTIVWKKYSGAKKDVEFVNDERELIVRFKDVIREYEPDYLTGYFSDGFDFPYLRGRADKYKIKLDLGIDGSNVRFSKGRGSKTAKICGIPHIDAFKFVRRVLAGELNLPAYDLDTVANSLLGTGKSGANVENLYRAWDKGGKAIEEFCEYNLVDAKITLQLTEKLLPHVNEFIKLCGLLPEEITRMSYGRLVENFVLNNLEQFNEIAPNRPHSGIMNEREGKKIEGAFVYQPTAGVYEDVAVLDFKSLYPTIISAHNICPSTLTDSEKEVNKSPEIKIDGTDTHFCFTYKYDGIFPKLIREILVRRNRVKEMLKKDKKDPALNARQYGLKILANSAYGYLGFFGARWYCKECAASTTAYGRDYIKKLMERAEKEKLKVIYGDTDSIFISLGKGKSMKDAEKFLKDVNNDLPSLMELELDGFYKRGIFVTKKGDSEKGAKKKYALITEDKKIKIVGFETVRGDWSKIAKEVQEKVLEIILKENDVKKAIEYVKEIVKKTKEGKIPIKKMIIKKRLIKEIEDYVAIGPHVNVAKKLVKRGETVGAGSDILYVVQPGKGNIGARALPSDEAKIYDPEYYINHQIIPVVERILSAVGYEKEDVTNEQKQKSLGDF